MIKILIVDDEKGVTDTLKGFFKEQGFSSMGAYSGEKAMSIVKKDAPNIVILDVKMEGMDGLEVLTNVKKIDEKIKVIMLSAIEKRETVHDAFDMGAEEYIFKPFKLQTLSEIVQDKVQQIRENKSL